MVEGLGPSPLSRKKIIFFCPQNDNFDAVFNRQKPWDTDFTVQSQIDTYKNTAKIIQKFTVRPKGAVASSPPPEYATAVRDIILRICAD